MSEKVHDIDSFAIATHLRPRFRRLFRRSAVGRVVGKKIDNDITGSLPPRVRRKKISKKIKSRAVSSSAISSLSTLTRRVLVKKEVPDSVNPDDDKFDNLQRVIDLVAIGTLGENATIDNRVKQYDGSEDDCERGSIGKEVGDFVMENLPLKEDLVMEDLPLKEDPVMENLPLKENPVMEDFPLKKDLVMENLPLKEDLSLVEDTVMEDLPLVEDPLLENLPLMEDPVMEDCDNKSNIKVELQSIVNENHPVIETSAEFLKRLQGSSSLCDQLYIIYFNEERLPFLMEESETVTRVLLTLLNSYRLELLDKIAIVAQSEAAAFDEQYVYDDYKNLVMDQLLLKHLWHRVSQQDFWQLIFPRMCDIAFFVNVPQTVREQKALFGSTRLDVLRNQDWQEPQYNNNDADIHPGDTTIANILDDNEGDEQSPTASAQITDRVYRAMRLEFFTILRGFLLIIWKLLLNVDDSNTFVHFSKRNELIANAYTFASFHGCVLLSAPLSIFASLTTMNAANFTQIEKLCDCLNRKYCDRIFDTTIAYTLFAAIHYTMVSRGFQPVHIWPVKNLSGNNGDDKPKCP